MLTSTSHGLSCMFILLKPPATRQKRPVQFSLQEVCFHDGWKAPPQRDDDWRCQRFHEAGGNHQEEGPFYLFYSIGGINDWFFLALRKCRMPLHLSSSLGQRKRATMKAVIWMMMHKFVSVMCVVPFLSSFSEYQSYEVINHLYKPLSYMTCL